jgi:hypothetical protein
MAIPSKEREAELRKKYPGLFAPAAPAPSAAPAPRPQAPAQRRAAIGELAAESASTEALRELEDEETRLLQAELLQIEREQPMLSDEAKREEAQRRVREARPAPIFAGGFEPFRYELPVAGVAPPINVPAAEPATLGTALLPQTRVPAATARRAEERRTEGLFDDKAFNESIKDLTPEDKREQLDAYEAFKAAFKKVRQLNPVETGVSDDDIIKDLQRQLKALGEGEITTFVDDPALRMGYTGDPLARALQQQVTPSAPIPKLEPGQVAFIGELDRIKRGRRVDLTAAQTEETLRARGVEITKTVPRPTGERGPGGKPVLENVEVGTGQFRPATEDEIKAAVEGARRRETEAAPLPFYATERRDEVLRNLEKGAKGGFVFQKEYETGATVESPVSWFTRSALAVPNALVGAASELFTPEVIEARERADRPALYRDAPAYVFNVAEARGLMGEVGDLYEYAPETWTIGGTPLKEYTTLAKAAGFAGDIIGFDLGLIAAGATGIRGGAAAARAARAAGEGAGAVAGAAARTGLKGAGREFLETVGLGTLAGKIDVGDVRLQFGASLGDSFRAADEYERVINAGGDHAAALVEAERVAPKAKFVDDAKSAGPSIVDDVRTGRYFDDAAEWDEYKKVVNAVDSARAGANLETAGSVIRPYIAAAVRESPAVMDALRGAAGTVTGLSPRMKVSKVLETVNNTLSDVERVQFYRTVADTAAAEKGFTVIDRATKGTDPGRYTIRLTPSTFTTSDGAVRIIEEVRGGDEFRLIDEIVSSSPGRGVYTLDAAQQAALRDIIRQQAISSTLPRGEATRILNKVTRGTVDASDLRQVMYSVTDAVAAKGSTGFKSRALAPAGSRVELREKVAREVPVPSARAEVYGGDTGLISSTWRSIASKTKEWMGKVGDPARYLNSDQLRILTEGRTKMGNLGNLLERGLKAAPGRTPYEKVASLVGNSRRADTWTRIAQSAIFGRKQFSGAQWFLGTFEYDDVTKFLTAEGAGELQALIGRFIGSDLNDVNNVSRFIDEVAVIASNRRFQNPAFVDQLGQVFSLRGKPEEVLTAAWARGEANRISTETVSRILDFEPDTLGPYLDLAISALGPQRGRLLINSVTAANLQGIVLRTADDLVDLPLVRQMLAAEPGLEAAIRARASEWISAGSDTAAAIRASYANDAALIAVDAEKLAKGSLDVKSMGAGPLGRLLQEAIEVDFGKAPKFDELINEMGIMAERAEKGERAAVSIRNRLGDLWQAYNSAFYNLILYLNPRFHGVNISTAPYIAMMTTGALPASPHLGARVLMSGASVDPAVRATVVATDRFGVPVTAGELYDKAVVSGVFKSQAAANIDPRFLDDARRLGLSSGMLGKAAGKAERLTSLPASFAQAVDDTWRLSYTVDAINSGKTVDEAIDIGRRSLFDYGSATEFERKFVSKYILFYNFFRNSIVEGLRVSLTNPSRIIRQMRFTTDMTKMQVGEDKWNEMRWYTPYDAGIGRVVLELEGQAGREGRITMMPNMPYYDLVYLTSGLMTTPVGLMLGAADPVKGRREFGAGYVFSKLRPEYQTAIAALSGQDALYDVKLKKNRIPVEHIAFMDAAGLKDAWTTNFNAKMRPAEGGEEAYDGQVYELSSADFERYKSYMKAFQLLGAKRFFDDWGKFAGSVDLFGAEALSTGERATFTGPEMAGLVTRSSAGLPMETETRALEQAAKETATRREEREIETGAAKKKERK